MRFISFFLLTVIFALTVPVSAAPPVAAPVPVRAVPAPAQIRLELRLTRTNKESGAVTDTKVIVPPSPAIATPTLSTLDRGTATVSLANKDLSYSISASPSLEQAQVQAQGDKSAQAVQVLWNLRLSGRALPEGTNSVTTTGATRVVPAADTETLLTELPIADAKTGNISVFRLTVRVVVTKAASSSPETGPVPPSAP